MASTFILGKQAISLDSVRLGRLVGNIANPQDFYYDPSPAAGLAPIVTEHKDFRAIDDSNRDNRFYLKVIHLVSLGYSKRHARVSHVKTECVKHYLFDNSTRYFRDIIQLTETRKWIETAIKEGEQICLLVGFVTFLNADVTESETRFNSSDLSLSVTVPEDVLDTSIAIGGSVNRGGAIKSKFTAKGEMVYALQYRKVKISLLNSKDLDRLTLGKSQWEVLTKHRQAQTKKENDVVEADLNESEERDNFEFDDDDEDDDEGWTKLVDEEGDFYL